MRTAAAAAARGRLERTRALRGRVVRRCGAGGPACHTPFRDALHVRLPCSPHNQYRRRAEPDIKHSRWALIWDALGAVLSVVGVVCAFCLTRCAANNAVASVPELQRVMNLYLTQRVDLTSFHRWLFAAQTRKQRHHLFAHTLRTAVRYVLHTPRLLCAPVALLVAARAEPQSVLLSRRQCACLVANMLLLTLPAPAGTGPRKECDARRLWEGPGGANGAKLCCLFAYVDRAAAWLEPVRVCVRGCVFTDRAFRMAMRCVCAWLCVFL